MTSCYCVFEDRGFEDLTNKCCTYKKIVSRITISCVGQAVIVIIIVIIIVVSVKCEQCHKSSADNKEFN